MRISQCNQLSRDRRWQFSRSISITSKTKWVVG